MISFFSASWYSSGKMKWNLPIMFFGILFMVLVIYTLFYNVCLDEKSLKNIGLTQKHEHLNFPYVKESAKTSPMQHFDGRYLYSIKELPKKNFEEEQEELLMGMVKKVASKLNMSPSDFSDGSFRLLKNGLELNLFFSSAHKRIAVFQPFDESFQMREIPVQSSKKVHIILPLKGKLSSLSTFLEHLTSKVLSVDSRITLTIVYFNDSSMIEARRLLKRKLSAFPFFEWRFVPTNDNHFSRGKGIRIGIEAAAKNPSELVFVCDADVLFMPEFLMRCRANSIYGYQVYFPVLYSLHNPELVYRLYDKEVPPILDQLTVDSDNGFWRHFGFGMFCMHKKEYDMVGGVPELSTWGREDLMFYERFGDFPHIKVVRSLDSGVFHIFHPKNCTNVTPDSYPSCLFSKAASEGTQLQLGLLLFKLQDDIDLEGLLSKRFYYTKWIPFLAVVCVLLSVVVSYQCALLKRKHRKF